MLIAEYYVFPKGKIIIFGTKSMKFWESFHRFRNYQPGNVQCLHFWSHAKRADPSRADSGQLFRGMVLKKIKFLFLSVHKVQRDQAILIWISLTISEWTIMQRACEARCLSWACFRSQHAFPGPLSNLVLLSDTVGLTHGAKH